ncbi:MAG: TatD family hydrolase [Alphaproteobacteria bacterium GM202ARS2]|nr:TatD family hydrolase [Alphaproteobacteria bacterium GM202ARS2]
MTRPSFIDSHCHLDWRSFADERDAVVARAHEAGVNAMLSINTHPKSFASLHGLVQAYPNVWCSVGIHPCYTEEEGTDEDTLADTLRACAQHDKVIAFGESGLDYKEARGDKDKQKRLFRIHLQVACQCDLPIIIHVRDAEEDLITLIDDFRRHHPELRGVLHCFSGSAVLAKKAVEWGFFVSMSGLITYNSCRFLLPIVREHVPASHLLLETDSPFLAPTPKRGARNEPAFLVHTAEKVAELKNMSVEQLARQTSDNFFRLFRKARADAVLAP